MTKMIESINQSHIFSLDHHHSFEIRLRGLNRYYCFPPKLENLFPHPHNNL